MNLKLILKRIRFFLQLPLIPLYYLLFAAVCLSHCLQEDFSSYWYGYFGGRGLWGMIVDGDWKK